MKVLIVKTSSMGDILQTLPSLTDAVRAIPGISFDWVIEKEFEQIPTWHTAVDHVIPVSIRNWRKAWFSDHVKILRKKFRELIDTRYYDVIIDAQGLIKSALLITRLSRGIKHGMDWRSTREPLACLFYDRHHHILQQQHAVERTRELFAKSLEYTKPNSKGNYGITKHFSNFNIQNTRPYIIIVHATTSKEKHWPETHWHQLIELMQPYNINIKLPWSNTQEKQRAERLAANRTYVEVLPYLSLTQIACQLIGARIIISVDTGLSHLSAALNCPNITLFGPTDPKFIGGYGKNQHYIMSLTKQMKKITANEVFTLIRKKNIFININF